jgi:hypothetical protein
MPERLRHDGLVEVCGPEGIECANGKLASPAGAALVALKDCKVGPEAAAFLDELPTHPTIARDLRVLA